MSTEQVRAAGGVVVRDGRVAVVHRPKYDDWSLPKGKLDPGEGWEQAALREVEEETGLCCRLLRELDDDLYLDRRGRPKRVRWWAMEVVEEGPFAPSEEVDELRWVPAAEAGALLSYAHDRALVDAVAQDAGGGGAPPSPPSPERSSTTKSGSGS
jgi:8-oxo-dGTP diphosphatase